MPLYEYQCRKCGVRVVNLEKSGQKSRKLKCSGCGTLTMDRIISTFNTGGHSPPSGAKASDLVSEGQTQTSEGQTRTMVPEFYPIKVTNNPENL